DRDAYAAKSRGRLPADAWWRATGTCAPLLKDGASAKRAALWLRRSRSAVRRRRGAAARPARHHVVLRHLVGTHLAPMAQPHGFEHEAGPCEEAEEPSRPAGEPIVGLVRIEGEARTDGVAEIENRRAGGDGRFALGVEQEHGDEAAPAGRHHAGELCH